MRPMNPNDPNVAMLEVVAARLGPDLRERFVFVGGCVAGLLITDPAMPAIRPTEDVDIVVEVVALAGYHQIEGVLRGRGFEQDMSPDAPICRWRVGGVTVDVMPTLEEILGFANRWYPLALSGGQPMALPSGVMIRVVQAPVFLATKLEAFHGRGHGDHLFSHDLGDIVSVIDGRDSIVDECAQCPAELRAWLSAQFSGLLADSRFHDSLHGHLPGDAASQERLPDLRARIQRIAGLSPT